MVNADEPLLAGAEYDGVVAAPAVGIGVSQPAGRAHERPPRFEQANDVFVCVENLFPLVFRKALGELSGFADWAVNLQAVSDACLVVLATVSWGRVDTPRAVLGRYIIGEHAQNFPLEERVLHLDAFELLTAETRQGLEGAESCLRLDGAEAAAFDDVDLAVRGLRGDVFEVRMERHGHAGRKRPRRGGPNDDSDPTPRQCRVEGGEVA